MVEESAAPDDPDSALAVGAVSVALPVPLGAFGLFKVPDDVVAAATTTAEDEGGPELCVIKPGTSVVAFGVAVDDTDCCVPVPPDREANIGPTGLERAAADRP